MVLLANVCVIETEERRQGSRLAVQSGSTLRDGTQAVDVVVSNLSETGCAIAGTVSLAVGTKISIGLVGFGTYEAKVVRNNGDTLGLEFSQPIEPRVVGNAFASTTVIVADGLPTLPLAPIERPTRNDEKWPIGQRVLFLGGSSVLLWAPIAKAIFWHGSMR